MYSSRSNLRGGSGVGKQYPSPYLQIAGTKLPMTVRELFEQCEYLATMDPLISAIIEKHSLYPVTDIFFLSANDNVTKYYKELLLKKKKMREFLVTNNKDLYTYGNSFAEVRFPMIKYLSCPSCGYMDAAKNMRHLYTFRNFNFIMTCPSCGARQPAQVMDKYIKSPEGISLINWSPNFIDIKYNMANHKRIYYLSLPPDLKNAIMVGDRETIEDVPSAYIQAAKEGKKLRFPEGQLYHRWRPSISRKMDGWGIPLLFPVLTSTYYMQVLRKAQESIAHHQLNQLWLISPSTSDPAGSPLTTANLKHWQWQMQDDVDRWRGDPNHIILSPLPVQHQAIGGNGRALLLHPELKLLYEIISGALGTPYELIAGTMSYSGSNTSLLMLEQMYASSRVDMLNLIQFIVDQISDGTGQPKAEARFTKFKMADDLQRSGMYISLVEKGLLSEKTLAEEIGFDLAEEQDRMEEERTRKTEVQRQEAIGRAHVDGESQYTAAIYQTKAQNEMAQAQQSFQEGADSPTRMEFVPPPSADKPEHGDAASMPPGATYYSENADDDGYEAKRTAAYIRKLEPADAQLELQRLRYRNSKLHSAVLNQINGVRETRNLNNPNQYQTPLVKPPRREDRPGLQ